MPMREMQHRYATWVYEELDARKALTAEKLGVDIKTLGKWLRDPESKWLRDYPVDVPWDEPALFEAMLDLHPAR